jgi:hypothetical protein
LSCDRQCLGVVFAAAGVLVGEPLNLSEPPQCFSFSSSVTEAPSED